jgi:hypothetical protein
MHAEDTEFAKIAHQLAAEVAVLEIRIGHRSDQLTGERAR